MPKLTKDPKTGSERLVWAQGSPSTLRAVSTTIRGTRVNLAAAICWENYIPLVRQSLYAQNVNLYLAPTADGRDAWLSLMRTVAIEGRCFVASSNMAARAPGATPTASAGGAVSKAPVANGSSLPLPNGPSPQSPELSPRAEMSPRAGAANAERRVGSRRRSIPCGDGNEIIIPDSRPHPHFPGSGPADAPVFEEVALPQRPKPHPHRRSSIICTDGSEMTYPPSISAWPARGPDPDYPGAEPTPPSKGTAGGARHAAPMQNGMSKGWASRGGSCIVGPFGDVLAGPQWEDDEGIIYADIDFDDCIRGRLDLDTAGSYSR